MPRVAASNGVRPEIRALGVMQLNKPVTPAEINAHVGTGDYAAKYISFLKNRYGFDFTVQKNGRQVVSYTMVSEPDNVADLRAAQPKSAAPKAAKPVKVKAVKSAAPKKPKASKGVAKSSDEKLAMIRDIAEKRKSKTAKVIQEPDAGEVTSYGVDADWDSMEGVDVSKLVA